MLAVTGVGETAARPVRVCLVTGAGSALDLPARLVGDGVEVTVVRQSREAPTAMPAAVRLIGLRPLDDEGAGDVDAIVFTVMRAHGGRPFDVVHGVDAYPAGWAAMIAARRLGLPAVVSLAGKQTCCDRHRAASDRVRAAAGAVLAGEVGDLDSVYRRLIGRAQRAFDEVLPAPAPVPAPAPAL